MHYANASVRNNEQVADGWFELSLQLPDDAEHPAPGQFFSMSVPTHGFRKPFAVSAFDEQTNEAFTLYQVRGRGTQFLSTLRPGNEINFMGFHGNGFPYPEETNSSGRHRTPPRAALLAGGIGLGPLLFWHNYLQARGVTSNLYAGFRTASLIPHKLLDPCPDVTVCTDDGTSGKHGTVLNGFTNTASRECTARDTILYMCGPLGMMKAVAAYAREKNMQCYASLETTMACCVGVCMGCTIPITETSPKSTSSAGTLLYKRVCIDGAIFSSLTVAWEELT